MVAAQSPSDDAPMEARRTDPQALQPDMSNTKTNDDPALISLSVQSSLSSWTFMHLELWSCIGQSPDFKGLVKTDLGDADVIQ